MRNKPVFTTYKVSASWCCNCRAIPWPEDLTIDVDKPENQDIIDTYDIKTLPCFIIRAEYIDEDGTPTNALVAVKEGLTAPSEVKIWSTSIIMDYLAKYYGYKKSEHFDKIVNARIKMNLDWNQCPCGGEGRGCISNICHAEIAKDGHCHCNCFLIGDK